MGRVFLVEAEVNGDPDSGVDGFAVFEGGLEAVELDGCQGLFVEAKAERLDDALILRVAVGIDNDGDDANALMLLAGWDCASDRNAGY